MNDILINIRKELGDTIKLESDIRELKKQLEDREEEIKYLKSENDFLKQENQKYKDAIQRKKFKIKDLKSKNRELNESHANLKRSISLKNMEASIKKPLKSKVPLKKSKSTTDPLNEDLDQIFHIQQDLTPNSPSLMMESYSTPRKKSKFELFDDYFKEGNSTSQNEKKQADSPTNISDYPPKVTPLFVIEKVKDDDQNNNDNNVKKENEFQQQDTQIQETKNVKTTKQKKQNVLPSPQPISELLEEIKTLDIDQIDPIVTRVLAESYSSLTALKRRYVDILNTFAVSIKKSKKVDDIHQIISFFVKFALRVSPESLELFKKSISSNRELSTAILTVEETNGIF